MKVRTLARIYVGLVVLAGLLLVVALLARRSPANGGNPIPPAPPTRPSAGPTVHVPVGPGGESEAPVHVPGDEPEPLPVIGCLYPASPPGQPEPYGEGKTVWWHHKAVLQPYDLKGRACPTQDQEDQALARVLRSPRDVHVFSREILSMADRAAHRQRLGEAR